MPHAASTALPPRAKIIAPAWAPSGLPVTATQCWPCSTGLCGLSARADRAAPNRAIAIETTQHNNAGRERIADLRVGRQPYNSIGAEPDPGVGAILDIAPAVCAP